MYMKSKPFLFYNPCYSILLFDAYKEPICTVYRNMCMYCGVHDRYVTLPHKSNYYNTSPYGLYLICKHSAAYKSDRPKVFTIQIQTTCACVCVCVRALAHVMNCVVV